MVPVKPRCHLYRASMHRNMLKAFVRFAPTHSRQCHFTFQTHDGVSKLQRSIILGLDRMGLYGRGYGRVGFVQPSPHPIPRWSLPVCAQTVLLKQSRPRARIRCRGEHPANSGCYDQSAVIGVIGSVAE